MSSKNIVHSFLSLFLAFIFPIIATAQQKPVISGPIDDAVRTAVPGSRHPLATPQYDVGSVDPTMRLDRMLLLLSASPQQEDALVKFLESQQDSTSPNYHHWLTAEEFGQKFGPSPQDVQSVSAWLQSRGFTVTATARSGRWIEFSGTAGQAERAFGTMLRQYQVAGERHIANATEISVPAAIAPVTRGVVSLHNFFKKPMLRRYVQARMNGDGTYTPINPDATFNTPNGPVHALTPGDYAKIYQFSPLYSATPTALNGAGVTIAIVARSEANVSDFSDFRRITGVQQGTMLNTVPQQPTPFFDPNNGDSVEVDLDAEWAGGVAPGATINVVSSLSTATTDGVDLSAAYIVDNNIAPVMSVSFGDCESDLGTQENAFFNSLWQQAAAEGISVMVSSGDSGAAGCDFAVQATPATGGLAVSGLASTPFNTAVGGTQFAESGHDATFWSSTNSSSGVSVNGYIPEVVWNETCDPTVANSPCATTGFVLASGGGGRSALYPKPFWQSGVNGIPADAARDIPDISLTAAGHDGYVICFDFSCSGAQALVGIVGGTSASSPSFAGLMAIVNQVAGRQGLANYKLYELARNGGAFCDSASRVNPAIAPPSTCLFNDVIFGSNSVPGLGGFAANAGYDAATGLGSVNAANLVNAWKAISLTGTTLLLQSNGATSIAAAHGTPVQFTATVTSQTTGNPSGVVALVHSNGSVLGSLVLVPTSTNQGQFSGTVSNLPGGTYTLTGHYPGDGLFGASDSSSLTVNITPEASVTTLRTFAVNQFGAPVATSTFAYGDFMDLHADVAGASGQGRPTGSLSFQEVGATVGLGGALVNLKGEAELIFPGGNGSFPNPLTVGPHTLTGQYQGDSSFNVSNASNIAVTITKANPKVDAGFFSDQFFVATVPGHLDGVVKPTGPILPTGTVQYLDNGAPLGGPVTIVANSDQAPTTATFATQGTHPITATYSGDATYNAAGSPVFNAQVSAPFFIFGAASATVAAGKSTTVNLNLGPASTQITFSGTVAFSCTSASPAVTCSVTPGSLALTPTAGGPITVTINAATNAGLHSKPMLRWPMALAGVLAVVVCGFSRKTRQPLLAVVACCLVLGAISCGGGGGNPGPIPTPIPTPTPNTQTTVKVTGTSASYSSAFTVNLTVTH